MKLGIFLQGLGNNQIAIESIASVNTILNTEKKVYPTFFVKEVQPFMIKPRTLATHFDKLYNYDGHVITTNLDTTYIALQCRRLKSVNLFLFDLEWTFNIGNYIINTGIYKNKDIEIFSPSKEYTAALENYCGRQAITTRGFNLNEIITRIQQRT